MNPHVKTFVAAGACTHRRLAAFNANAGEIVQASAATDRIAGVFDCPNGAATGERVDVVLFGPADVDYGGTVAAGALITADSNGKAVAAAPSAGVNNRIAGYPIVPAVDGDIAKTFINPCSLQGA